MTDYSGPDAFFDYFDFNVAEVLKTNADAAEEDGSYAYSAFTYRCKPVEHIFPLSKNLFEEKKVKIVFPELKQTQRGGYRGGFLHGHRYESPSFEWSDETTRAVTIAPTLEALLQTIINWLQGLQDESDNYLLTVEWTFEGVKSLGGGKYMLTVG